MPLQEDADVIRRFYEQWGRGDLSAALESVHPDVEIDWSESISPFGGIYRGHDGVRRFWEENNETWDEFRPRVTEAFECGGGLVTGTAIHARAKASGIELDGGGAVLWRLAAGQIVFGKLFQTTAQALAAGDGPQ